MTGYSHAGAPWRVERVASLAALGAGGAYAAFVAALDGGLARDYAPETMQATSVRYLGPHDTLYFLLAWQGPVLRGVAPLLLEARRWPHPRRLHAWGDVPGPLGLDAEFLVADAALAPACFAAFAAYLAGPGAADFDRIELNSVRETSALARHAGVAFAQAQRTRKDSVSYLVELPASVADYRATLKRSMLSDVERGRRRLQERGRLELCLRERLDATELDEVAAIHGARQAELTGQGHERERVFDEPATAMVQQQLLALDAQHGRARHYLLKLDGATIAYSLNHAHGELVVAHTTAFAPAWRKAGVGRLVALSMLEAEIDAGQARVVDLGPGTTQIKLDFANRRVAHDRYVCDNRAAWGARLRIALWRAAQAARRRLKR